MDVPNAPHGSNEPNGSEGTGGWTEGRKYGTDAHVKKPQKIVGDQIPLDTRAAAASVEANGAGFCFTSNGTCPS